MNNRDIYKKIIELADKLAQSGSSFSRADLAYELKQQGVNTDSPELSRIVYEAWIDSGRNANVVKAFTNNAGNRSLVEAYQVAAASDNAEYNKILSITRHELQEADQAINGLGKDIEYALTDIAVNAGAGMASILQGTAGVERIKKEAGVVYSKYTNLVNGYEEARYSIQETISAFVELRSYITKVFREYSMALVDVFGDAVKVVSPQLFNFDSIEWLDVQGMLQQTDLQYTTVANRCSNLMNEISDSFRRSLESSVNTYRSFNSREAGLIMAGIGMLGHYMDSSARTNELKSDFMRLKNDMRRDATQIKADLMRLAQIYSTLNMMLIPQAEVFMRHSGKVLTNEVDGLLSSIYSNKEAAKLKEKRDALLEEMKMAERYMNDEKANIVFYEGNIEENKALLENLKGQYEDAVNSKPSRPFFLVNWLTFGSAERKYNRNFFNWNQTCGPLVKSYEESMVDLDLDKKELAIQKKSFEEHLKSYNKCKNELNGIARKMMDSISVNDEQKKQMLSHLKDIVALLHVAKSISESSLDSKLVSTVKIKDFGTLEIPSEVNDGINALTNIIGVSMPEIGNSVGKKVHKAIRNREEDKIVDKVVSGNMSKDKAIQAFGRVDEEIPQVDEIANALPYQQAMDLLAQTMKLQALKVEEHKSEKFYAQQLSVLQRQFKESMSDVEDKSALLREVMARINTASTPQQLKEGLMALTGTSADNWSDNDWDSFINGNKSLTI